jgi:hypothetical protein
VAAEPGTGLITDCEMTMAAGDGSTDAENGVKMARRDRFRRAAPASDGSQAGPAAGQPQADAQPQAEAADSHARGDGLEVYGDSAYSSGQARAAYRDAGHDTVIKPRPVQPAVPGGFTVDDFTVSEDDGTVTCPAGAPRPMSPSRTVTFGAACAGCPLRSKCTTAKDGRSMTIHPHEQLLREARAQARTPNSGTPIPPGQRSSGSSPGPPPRTATASGSATSEPPGTTPGCTTGAPRSTCALCCGTG